LRTYGQKPLNPAAAVRRCGLCGKTKKLTRTECCGRWICDDEDQYVLFSYARNSCYRNHRRFTLCGHHHAEEHGGSWQTCRKCRRAMETEMYVYFGTNEYNFVKLENPPAYEPTRCSSCGQVIVLSEGGYSMLGTDYRCGECTERRWEERERPASPAAGRSKALAAKGERPGKRPGMRSGAAPAGSPSARRGGKTV
jgi:hypothetical protein